MQLKCWGVRGSIPTPGQQTVHFGGNTSCVEVIDDNEPIVILDAGTGIRPLGLDLVKNRPDKKNINIFFSHTHWDHIQGLPFFTPLYIPGYTVDIYGPVHYEKSLEEILDRQMEYTYFPVRVAELQAKITTHELKEEEFHLEGYDITSKYLNHPVLCLGYRFEKENKSAVYCTDHEPYYNYLGDDDDTGEEMSIVIDEQNKRLEDFIQDADLLIMDGQYTPDEYKAHIGWGHSTTEHTVNLAKKTGVKNLGIFHHDPDRVDDNEQSIIDGLQGEIDGKTPLKKIFGCREGEVLDI